MRLRRPALWVPLAVPVCTWRRRVDGTRKAPRRSSPLWRPCRCSCPMPLRSSPGASTRAPIRRRYGPASGRHPAEWRKPKWAHPMGCMVLVGCTIHDVHFAASAVFTAYEDAGTVTAVQIHGGARASPNAATLL